MGERRIVGQFCDSFLRFSNIACRVPLQLSGSFPQFFVFDDLGIKSYPDAWCSSGLQEATYLGIAATAPAATICHLHMHPFFELLKRVIFGECWIWCWMDCSDLTWSRHGRHIQSINFLPFCLICPIFFPKFSTFQPIFPIFPQFFSGHPWPRTKAAQTLRPEQLAAQLHRQRFQKILRRAPCRACDMGISW